MQCHAENRTPPIASVARSGRLHGILPASISTLQNMYVSKHPPRAFFFGGGGEGVGLEGGEEKAKDPKTPKLDGQASKQVSKQASKQARNRRHIPRRIHARTGRCDAHENVLLNVLF